MSHYHPPVTCPVCEEGFALYEVDAHLNFCMSKDAKEYADVRVNSGMDVARGVILLEIRRKKYEIDLNQMVQTNQQSGKKRQIMRSELGWKWKADDGLWMPYEPENIYKIERLAKLMLGENRQQNIENVANTENAENRAASQLVSLLDSQQLSGSVAGVRNPETAETETSANPLSPNTADTLTSDTDSKSSPESAAPAGEIKEVSSSSGSSSGSKLTRTQLAACAAYIMKEKSKADADKDVSLARLLQSFKSLGITRENLKKQI